MEINPVQTNSYSIFDHAINLLKLDMDKKNIHLVKNIEENMPQIVVDMERINQVLLNLMINSIEVMEDKGVMEVGAEFMKELNKIKLWISDTGPGIDPSKQKEIFDLFYTTREKGTGLGLAIVQKIVEYHDGTIEVESPVKDDMGTRFTILLPAGEINRLSQGD
jgi:two-component system sensor histidine kinase HydH